MKVIKETMNPRDLDKSIEIWEVFEMDIYAGFSKDEIIEGIIKDGNDSPETGDMKKIPRSEWAKKLIVNFEEPYQPRYTYEQTLCMMIDKGWDGKATIICTKEY